MITINPPFFSPNISEPISSWSFEGADLWNYQPDAAMHKNMGYYFLCDTYKCTYFL